MWIVLPALPTRFAVVRCGRRVRGLGQIGGQPLSPVEHPASDSLNGSNPGAGTRASIAFRYPRLAPGLPGPQHVLGWTAATGRRNEQLPRLPGRTEGIGQQLAGVLAGGAVDAPLQVTDRPRAQVRRLGQLLLGQPRLGPQLPQQPAETQRNLLRHQPRTLSASPAMKQPQHYTRPGMPTSLPVSRPFRHATAASLCHKITARARGLSRGLSYVASIKWDRPGTQQPSTRASPGGP